MINIDIDFSNMVNKLLDFLNASPVNFLAARNIATLLEEAGYRRFDPQTPLGKVKAGELPNDLCTLRLTDVPHQAQR